MSLGISLKLTQGWVYLEQDSNPKSTGFFKKFLNSINSVKNKFSRSSSNSINKDSINQNEPNTNSRITNYFKSHLSKISQRLPKNSEDLKKLSPEELLSAVTGKNINEIRQLLTSKSLGLYSRVFVAIAMSYFLADTVSLFTDSLVPEPDPIPAPRIVKRMDRTKTFAEYQSIVSRNIFNSKGLIPEDTLKGDGPARKTTLPLNLIGTVVLRDETKSIAAIEDKSQNLIFPLRIDDTMNGKIKITKIEHFKVTFVNQSNGNLEFVEIIDDAASLNVGTLPSASSLKKTEGGVSQVKENVFEVEKTVIDNSLKNMGEVLQQARAIPNFENGLMNGFRLIQIVPGSIYSKLGIVENDVICGVNGEPMNDAGKAFALFNELKNITHLELCVQRGGRKLVMSYDVK